MRYRFVGHKLRWAVLGPWMFSGYNSEPLAAFGGIQGRQSGMEAFRRSQQICYSHMQPHLILFEEETAPTLNYCNSRLVCLSSYRTSKASPYGRMAASKPASFAPFSRDVVGRLPSSFWNALRERAELWHNAYSETLNYEKAGCQALHPRAWEAKG